MTTTDAETETALYEAIRATEPDPVAYHALSDFYREQGLEEAADGVLRAAATGRRPLHIDYGSLAHAGKPFPSYSWLSRNQSPAALVVGVVRSEVSSGPFPCADADMSNQRIVRFRSLAAAWAFLARPDVTV